MTGISVKIEVDMGVTGSAMPGSGLPISSCVTPRSERKARCQGPRDRLNKFHYGIIPAFTRSGLIQVVFGGETSAVQIVRYPDGNPNLHSDLAQS